MAEQEPEDELAKQRREAIFRDLPQGMEPFTVSRERLLELDPATRNAVLEEQIFRQGQMRIAIDCPTHRTRMCVHCVPGEVNGAKVNVLLPDCKKPCPYCGGSGRVQQNAPMVFACRHVAPQDEKHPAGIVYTPKLYYVCKPCWNLIQGVRFDFGTEIITTCWFCVQAEAYRLVRIDPTLLLDLVNLSGNKSS